MFLMLNFTLADLSCRPLDTPRHWHPQSQAYAGGDCLLSALDCGWTVTQMVHCSQSNRGNRRVLVYFFELQRDSENLVMPVISNPYVERLLAGSPLDVVVMETSCSLLEVRAWIKARHSPIQANADTMSMYI